MLLFFYGGLFLTSHIFVDISFFSDAFRVVTKILSCQVDTKSGRGIKQLGISFGSIFV